VTLQEFFLLLVSVLTSVGGQFCLKAGAMKLGRASVENTVSHIISIITIPELLAGLTLYGLGALSYILLLTRVSLSIAAPAISLVYVFSALIGSFLFKEPLPISRLIGLALIMLGIILVVGRK